jgi:type II secretory pathway component PulK
VRISALRARICSRFLGRGENNRGVALIIVLLVTALLIALIFEFAYGTRISLRSAVNFRDSERAYYLARSGVKFAGLLLSYNLQQGNPQDNIEQRDWEVVPIATLMTGSNDTELSDTAESNDTELKVRWEDESGKINISNIVKGNTTYNRLVILFTNRGIDQNILDQISTWMIEERRSFYLLTELHQFLNDEDFNKVEDSLTLAPVTQININTASVDVLETIGINSNMAAMIVTRRKEEPFKDAGSVADFLGPTNTMAAGQLTTTSNVVKVDSFATVGGYTKQIEAIITRSTTGYAINYWRAL